MACLLKSQVGQILLHFDGFCTGQKFLSPPTNCLIRYPIRTINSHNLLKICANFSISSNSFNISIRFPNHFYSIKMTMWNWMFVFIPFERYWVKFFKSIIFHEIMQNLIALCYNKRAISNSPRYLSTQSAFSNAFLNTIRIIYCTYFGVYLCLCIICISK